MTSMYNRTRSRRRVERDSWVSYLSCLFLHRQRTSWPLELGPSWIVECRMRPLIAGRAKILVVGIVVNLQFAALTTWHIGDEARQLQAIDFDYLALFVFLETLPYKIARAKPDSGDAQNSAQSSQENRGNDERIHSAQRGASLARRQSLPRCKRNNTAASSAGAKLDMTSLTKRPHGLNSC